MICFKHFVWVIYNARKIDIRYLYTSIGDINLGNVTKGVTKG